MLHLDKKPIFIHRFCASCSTCCCLARFPDKVRYGKSLQETLHGKGEERNLQRSNRGGIYKCMHFRRRRRWLFITHGTNYVCFHRIYQSVTMHLLSQMMFSLSAKTCQNLLNSCIFKLQLCFLAN